MYKFNQCKELRLKKFTKQVFFMPAKIDETDKRMLNEMIKNHTARHSTLAKKMKLSPAAIHKHIKKLKRIEVCHHLGCMEGSH